MAIKSRVLYRRRVYEIPGFYGPYLELSDAPQKVLRKLDIECVSVKNSGEFTKGIIAHVRAATGDVADDLLAYLQAYEVAILV
jgi:hypothetical protein